MCSVLSSAWMSKKHLKLISVELMLVSEDPHPMYHMHSRPSLPGQVCSSCFHAISTHSSQSEWVPHRLHQPLFHLVSGSLPIHSEWRPDSLLYLQGPWGCLFPPFCPYLTSQPSPYSDSSAASLLFTYMLGLSLGLFTDCSICLDSFLQVATWTLFHLLQILTEMPLWSYFLCHFI